MKGGPDRQEGTLMSATTEQGWTVHVDATVPRKLTMTQIDALFDQFEDVSGVISGGRGKRFGVTFSLRDRPEGRKRDAADIAQDGLTTFQARSTRAGVLEFEVVELRVQTFAEQDRELAEPAFPELVGVAELAALFGFSPQRASELAKRDDFPSPLTTLKSGPVWVRANVESFKGTDWRRKPGRKPRKSDALAEVLEQVNAGEGAGRKLAAKKPGGVKKTKKRVTA